MSIEDATNAIASAVAREHRERFARTFLGTLLGQALVLLGMLLAYVAALGLLFRNFRDDLSGLRDWAGEATFWGILLAPLAVIVAFSLLPTAFQAWRERRLRGITITDAARAPGQFRLHPYGPRDQDAYSRPDGADDRAVAWLEGTDRALLYLSGASGSGKSSLLGAAVLPRLRAAGWRCLTPRVYADPVAQLREALVTNKDLLPKTPAADTALRTLLERAASSKGDRGPLLIVIDQFEEFLILNDEAARAPFVDLLRALDADPIANFHLLLVFRSDYRELLFKLGLPRYVSGENAFELAPFLRSEAEGFLRAGGRVLAPEGYDALFAGLDRIEEARGLYRPITLNMVGLVLERMGGRVTGDPARLIEQYLRNCVAAGPARDFAAPILREMITASGTKEPRDVNDLATATGFAPWQVENTLADLDIQGLVRPLDAARGRWEISHDFLARQVGILLGRLRRPWLRRAAPIVLPIAAFGWVAALFLALDYWPSYQERRALDKLSELQIVRVKTSLGEVFSPLHRMDFDDAAFREFAGLYGRLRDPPTGLDLGGAASITSLEPLKGIPLTALDLTDADGITSLEPLKRLPLTWLDLSGADGITSLEPLRDMPLTWLDLSESGGITSLEPLSGMPLAHLNLAGATGITSLDPLQGMPLTWLVLDGLAKIRSLDPLQGMSLTSLGLRNAESVTTLEPLQGMPLTVLDLFGTDGITNLEPLRGMPLTKLSLSDTGITSLAPLRGMPLKSLYLSRTRIANLESLRGMLLTELSLASATGITSLEALEGMPLTWLDLSGCSGITNLEPLHGLPLKGLRLRDVTGISSLAPLQGMPLNKLDLSGATGITTLAPLKGMNPTIVAGASEALLATLQ